MASHPLIIYGCGGLGREVALAARAGGALEPVGFCDDGAARGEVHGIPVLGGLDALAARPDPLALYLAIGDRVARQRLLNRLGELGRSITFPNVVHPAATADGVRFGVGNYVAAGARLSADVRLGDFNIVNFNAVLGHDAVLGDHCQISPGAVLNGQDVLGDGVLVGAGAVVMPRLQVAAAAVVGIGAVVVAPVAAGCTVAGNPARVIRRPEAGEGPTIGANVGERA